MSQAVDHEGAPRDRSREAGHDGAMFKPGRGRVFLRPEEPPERTPSGLYLPQTVNHEPIHFGIVLAVGAPAQERYVDAAGKLHVWDVPPEYEVGDRVLYVYAVALKRVRHFSELVVCAQEEIQRSVKYLYGLSQSQQDEMLREQGGRCAICARPLGPRNGTSLDHDHATGKARAFTCLQCNVGIGMLRDSSKIALSAARYLRRFGR